VSGEEHGRQESHREGNVATEPGAEEQREAGADSQSREGAAAADQPGGQRAVGGVDANSSTPTI